MTAKAPLVIVGGGPAGAMAACLLAQQGQRPLLLERHVAPHDVVCGAFLGPDTLARLATVGINPDQLGASHIHALRLVRGSREIVRPLPFAARGLSRLRMDAALLDTAAQQGADIRRGAHVTRMLGASDGLIDIMLRDGSSLRTGTAMLASGKHDLHGAPRPYPAHRPQMIGLKQTLNLSPAQTDTLRGWIELYLFPGGYAGLQLVESNQANLCLIIDSRLYAGWDALLQKIATDSPLFAARLASAAPCHARPLAIANIPYGYRYRATAQDWPGLYRLGDQAAVIASLAGDGIGIALASAQAAVDALTAGWPAPRFHKALSRTLRPTLRSAGLLQAAALNLRMQNWAMALLACQPWLLDRMAWATRLPAGPVLRVR